MHKSRQSPEINSPPPTVFLLRSSQPLKHVSRLILTSLTPATPSISYRSVSMDGRTFAWSDSTDEGDFIRDNARATEFEIVNAEDPSTVAGRRAPKEQSKGEGGLCETAVRVEVPSFPDHTRFMRRRLGVIEELWKMEGLKRCKLEVHQNERGMTMGGFGLPVY
ncbi:hypothetical protein AcV7_002337 [Taiwanofungus camphoratus]|nr:hypothetical protein AcV7_002337 [Antrodia cinnamomea]